METNKRPTQCARIMAYMEKFGSITQLEALRDLGIMRLASRISELRKNGVDITSAQIGVLNRFGEVCYIKQYSFGGANND